MNSTIPPSLKSGDTIAITCPAKFLPGDIDFAADVFRDWGLNVILGDSCSMRYHQFSAPDEVRASELQEFIADPHIKAVICGRGGYGVLRLLDRIDFSPLTQQPKFICGFSDITLLLAHVYSTCRVAGIHAPMPYTFPTATTAGLDSFKNLLFGLGEDTNLSARHAVAPLTVQGTLIGGNLSLLAAALASNSYPDCDNAILVLEDVGEAPYSIDKMIRMLDRAGKLSGLRALLIGEFNELPEESVPFGATPGEIITEVVAKYGYPVVSGVPVGHIDDNRAFVFGARVKLTFSSDQVNIQYLNL